MARITAASMPRLRETYSHVPSRLTVMKRPSHIVSILPVIENPFLPGEVRVGWERAGEGKRNLQFDQPVGQFIGIIITFRKMFSQKRADLTHCFRHAFAQDGK